MGRALWVPPGVAAERAKQRGDVQEVRPFADLQKHARSMGWAMRLRHDPGERTIEIDFVPQTDKLRQAVKVYSQSSKATSYRVAATYSVLQDWMEKALECIEKGLEDLRQL